MLVIINIKDKADWSGVDREDSRGMERTGKEKKIKFK